MKALALAPLALLALPSCVLPTFAVQPRLGPVDVDGEVGVSNTSVTSQNSADDMGIEEDDAVPGVRADFQWGSPHLSVALQQSEHDGNGTLTADLSQGPITITQGTAVATELDLGLHTAYLTFDVIPGDWELGLGLGLVVLDFDLETSGGGNVIQSDATVPVPVLAARAGGGLGPVDVEALLGVLGLEVDGDELTVIDLDVHGTLRLFGDGDRATGALTLGLRYTDVELEYDDGSDEVDADLDLTGPYLGFRLQF